MASHDETFHTYLLIGQSNMAGRGVVGPQDKEIHPRVLALNRDCEWVPAVDPIHFDKPIAGVGPGLTFGKIIAGLDSSIRIGLIPCAAGGSPITAWQPGCCWEQTNSMPYDNAVRRARLAMSQGVLRGILWHQGESDSYEQKADLYEDRLIALIKALRADLDMPAIPFVVGTLGDFFVENCPPARLVNEALQRVPQRIERAACVMASGLGHIGDQLHFSAEAAHELGARYAAAMMHLQQRSSSFSPILGLNSAP